MFKSRFIIMLIVALFVLPIGVVYSYQSHYGPTELTYYDKSKAYNGYTLFSPFRT